jgi:hypothetical protein
MRKAWTAHFFAWPRLTHFASQRRAQLSVDGKD